MKINDISNKHKGFTLLEMIIVIGILASLAAFMFTSYVATQRSARDSRRRADLEQIRAAIEQWRSDKGEYPSSAGATIELKVDCNDNTLIDTVPNPDTVYLQKVPKDPQCTGRIYYYNRASPSDYTLAAGLESVITVCAGLASPACGVGINCSYCVGPYGQK